MRLSLTLLMLFFFFISETHGQRGKQSSAWAAAFNTIKINKKLSVQADVQYRSNDKWQQLQTQLLRAGLNIHLDKQFMLTSGYAHIKSYRLVNGKNRYAPEQRLWQQLIFTHRWKQVAIQHRLRAEARFISKDIVPNGQWHTNGVSLVYRGRYFARGIIPFKPEPVFKKGLYCALQNEVFMNLHKDNAANGKIFDQNRAYLALGFRTGTAFDLEAGYMNQYVNGRATNFTNNHIAQVATYLRL